MGEAHGRRRRAGHRRRGARASVRALLSRRPIPVRAWRWPWTVDRPLDHRPARRPHHRRQQSRRRRRTVRGPASLTTFLDSGATLWGMYNVSPAHAIGLVGGMIALPIALLALRRSEERRVGKEGREGWATEYG